MKMALGLYTKKPVFHHPALRQSRSFATSEVFTNPRNLAVPHMCFKDTKRLKNAKEVNQIFDETGSDS